MARNKTKGEAIIEAALRNLEANPEGLRYAELVSEIHNENPSGFNPNTIRGAIWDLDIKFPKRVSKPSRGLFRLVKYGDDTLQPPQGKTDKTLQRVREEDFYQPFADYLVQELEECTLAIPLGGNSFQGKWGTPDVIGKRESKKSDIVPAPVEIVSAEIKTDANQIVTAFGQACSYRLFSHKSFLVIPSQASRSEKARIEALCQIFGVGLILFDAMTPDDPKFEIRARAIKGDPDLFFANKNLASIEKKLWP